MRVEDGAWRFFGFALLTPPPRLSLRRGTLQPDATFCGRDTRASHLSSPENSPAIFGAASKAITTLSFACHCHLPWHGDHQQQADEEVIAAWRRVRQLPTYPKKHQDPPRCLLLLPPTAKNSTSCWVVEEEKMYHVDATVLLDLIESENISMAEAMKAAHAATRRRNDPRKRRMPQMQE